MSGSRLERVQELRGRLNRRLTDQRDEVGIAADEQCLRGRRKRDQVVVASVPRPERRLANRVVHDERLAFDHEEIPMRFIGDDARTDLAVRQHAAELIQQSWPDDELEGTTDPRQEDASGRAVRRQERRDEDVGVEDCAHALSAATDRVLRLDREAFGLAFRQIVPSPAASEQVQAEIAAQRVLDDRAVSLPGPGSPDFYRPHNLFVDGERRPNLRHLRIIAS
jgi:hypothetical protein